MSLTRKLIVAHDHTFNNGESFPLTNMGSGGASEGQVPVADGTGGITWGSSSGGVEEGPGIDIVDGNVVGLGLDSILIAHSDGSPASEFPATTEGLGNAIASVSPSETIILPLCSIDGSFTIPENVTVMGMDRTKSVLSGQITLSNNSLLSYLSVNRHRLFTSQETTPFYGILGPQRSGQSARLLLCDVNVVDELSYDTIGVAIQGGDVEVDRCHIDTINETGTAESIKIIGYNFMGETGTYDSWSTGANLVGTSYTENLPTFENLEIPIISEGGETNYALIRAGNTGTATVVYDLGCLYDMTGYEVYCKWDCDLVIDLSMDGITWVNSFLYRTNWADASWGPVWSGTGILGFDITANPWRYMRFTANQIVLVGDHIELGHWHLTQATPHLREVGLPRIHHSVVFGTTYDLDAVEEIINVFSVQYDNEKINGTIILEEGDRYPSIHYHPQYQDDITVENTDTIVLNLTTESHLNANLISGAAIDGQVLVADGLGGVEWRDSGGTKTLSVIHADGSPVETFDTVAEGLSNVVSGDIISITKPGIYTGNITIPSGVSLIGSSQNDIIIDGLVTLNDGSHLENLSIIRQLNTANAEFGVLGTDIGKATLLDCYISITQTGAGTAHALRIMGGNTESVGCVLFGTTATTIWGGSGQWQSRHDSYLSSILAQDGYSPVKKSTFDADLDGWIPDPNGAFILNPSRYTYNHDTTQGHDAPGSMHTYEAGGEAAGGDLAYMYKTLTNVTARTGDTFSMWARMQTGSYAEPWHMKLTYSDGTSTLVTGSANSTWGKKTFTVPAGDNGKPVTRVTIGFQCSGWEGFSASDWWFDDVEFTLMQHYQINMVKDIIDLEHTHDQLHDPITIVDSTTIDFTLTGQELTASVIPSGIDAGDLGSGTATDGHVLTADGLGGSAWEQLAPGASDLNGLTDVVITTPTEGQTLLYDNATSTWKNADASPAPQTVVLQAIFTVIGTLSIGNGSLRIYNATGINKTISKIFLSVGTAPTGASIIVDVNKNGTTIFTTQTNRPQIIASANTGNTTTIEIPNWNDGEYLTVDIDQIGSTVAGSDLTVHIVYS